ncbi:flagellar hook protein FlgE [Alkalilimnicola ehrlichii]|uniref:flagellar hook protein FlgE n=1 Tax=Alkalilimnicola ehrlichii TaxID=351052 RepID=UPI002162AF7A|nr:flagellar hook-basal body complex protein [Alkalilimnicola ehrlichii]
MSFESALTGLKAASASLDVTGNNIANGQTHGFKQSRAEFADIFATSHLGVAQNAIGHGVRLTNVKQLFEQGQPEFTGKTLDMMVNGTGFFRMDNNGSISYTRAGNFDPDPDGYIVNPDGHRLTGYQMSPDGNVTNALGPMRINTGDIAPNATQNFRVSANMHAFAETLPAGAFDADDPNTYSYATTGSVFDSLGREHMIDFYFVKTDDPDENTWEVHTRLGGQEPDNSDPIHVQFDNNGMMVASARQA